MSSPFCYCYSISKVNQLKIPESLKKIRNNTLFFFFALHTFKVHNKNVSKTEKKKKCSKNIFKKIMLQRYFIVTFYS